VELGPAHGVRVRRPACAERAPLDLHRVRDLAAGKVKFTGLTLHGYLPPFSLILKDRPD
jgi:hypothetical protein